jgi:hypothetical protein
MGYHRPVSQWNHGKKSEYAERKEYIPPMINHKTEPVVAKPVSPESCEVTKPAVVLSESKDYGVTKKEKPKQYQELSAFVKATENKIV